MNVARLILVLVIASIAMSARAEPLEFPNYRPACVGRSKYPVWDISMPVHKIRINEGTVALLQALQDHFKVSTIFRYYDDPDHPSLAEKTLRADESTAILEAGLKIGVVFQHNNSSVSKFTAGAGKKDAGIALAMADDNKQPYNTAIYFGVDGPFDEGKLRARFGQNLSDDELVEKMRVVIKEYFQEIKTAFNEYAQNHGGAGYNIGIYCSAEMCSVGTDLNLKHLWLSAAGRDSKYFAELFANPAKVNLVQSRESLKCEGWVGVPHGQSPTFDINQVNNVNSDLGTWDHKRQ